MRVARLIKRVLGRKGYDTSRSTLLAELHSIGRPLVVCHSTGTTPQFVLDLNERVFCHATLSTTSDTFFVDYGQTDDDSVVLTGSTLDGNEPWEITITRAVDSNGLRRYLADVVIDKDEYRRRMLK